MSEGEEKEQEIGNLLEKIMKENFLNSVTEIGIQVQEEQRVPNKMDAALAGLAQWIECQPVNQGVTGLIPSWGTCLSSRPDPQ